MKSTIALHVLFLCLGFAALFTLAPIVYAADQVVSSCASDSELRSDLAAMQGAGGGGTLTFTCQGTIAISSQLPAITRPRSLTVGTR